MPLEQAICEREEARAERRVHHSDYGVQNPRFSLYGAADEGRDPAFRRQQGRPVRQRPGRSV